METNPITVQPATPAPEPKQDDPGTWLGRQLLDVVPEGSIFHKGVKFVDETAEELIFEGGIKVPKGELSFQKGYEVLKRQAHKLVADKYFGFDIKQIKSPEAERLIKEGIATTAQGLLMEVAPGLAKNIY